MKINCLHILVAHPLNKLYLILGLGFPSAAHFNVTLSPSFAVVLAGGIVITGEDQLGNGVVRSSCTMCLTNTEGVTGAELNK